MWSSTRCIEILYFVFVYYMGFLKYSSGELSLGNNVPHQPFTELPCLTIGGICTREDNCSKGSTVPVKGLCPLQQEEGTECCKPENPTIKCRSRGGSCESIEDIECPQAWTFKDATDCRKNEVCCIVIK